MHKKYFLSLAVALLMVFVLSAQRSLLSFDYYFTDYIKLQSLNHENGLLEKMNRCNANYIGGSIQIPLGYNNMIGIGMGLKKVNYQKD